MEERSLAHTPDRHDPAGHSDVRGCCAKLFSACAAELRDDRAREMVRPKVIGINRNSGSLELFELLFADFYLFGTIITGIRRMLGHRRILAFSPTAGTNVVTGDEKKLQRKIPADRLHGIGFVQRIKMQPRHPEADQLLAKLRRVV